MEESDYETIRQGLAESGENLARAAATLTGGTTAPDDFFDKAGTHMSLLESAGKPDEAFATGVMALLTAFSARFNPGQYSKAYLAMLLRVAMDAAMAMAIARQNGDKFAIEHYDAIDRELGPLVLDSYRALDGANVVPAGMRAPFEQLDKWVDTAAEFQGHTIKATDARGILYDIASRLVAMGLIE